MKYVIWKDESGIKHRSALKDDMPETEPQMGMIADPPDIINGIDWTNVAKDLHNLLVERGLFTYQDVLQQQNGVTGAVISALKKRVTRKYKEEM